MKRIIVVMSICLLSFFLSIKTNAQTNNVFIKEDNKVMAASSEFTLKETNPGKMLVKEKDIMYIYNNQEICNLKEEYLTHIVDTENLYLVTKDTKQVYLRSINLKNKKENIIPLTLNKCFDILIIDNELTLIGSTNDDASITKYTKNLNFLYDYKFGGSGKEAFVKAYYDNNQYYLIGLKDAHSKNSPFMDVGSQNEVKTFVSIVSENGIIEDSIYFNHQEEYEELYTSSFNNDLLMVSIKLNNSYQTYVVDSNLEKVYYEETTNMDCHIVFSNTEEILYIDNDYLKVKEDQYILDIPGEILLSEMRENTLKIFYYDDYYIWETVIYQYDIDKQEDIIINLFNSDFDPNMSLDDLEEIKITSHIHDIKLELTTIEPYFSKQITGEYLGSFKLIINDQKSFNIDNKIIVEEYVNIYDKHIYPVGYKLKFFGYGMLDGKSVASGVVVKDVGEHVLLISDASGKTKKYTFQVVDNYYNNQEELPPTDYVIRKNDNLEISFKSNYEIEKVYINNQEVLFKQENELVKVVLDSFNETGVYEYKIDKIECRNEVIEINEKFTVKVLKEEPQVNIKEQSSKDFTVTIDFYDPDLSVKDLVFEVYKGDNLEEICHTYLNDFSYKVGNIQKDKNITVRSFLVYDIGDGELKYLEILDSSFFINVDEYELFNLTREDNQITMVVKTNNPKLNISKLIINDVDFQGKYQTSINYQPLYISIIISVIVILIGGGFIYYFKVFKKKKNQ